MGKEFLSHHGIKGQRWGVRRFQNEDGSLTSIGQKRYGDPDYKKDYDESDKDQLTRDYKRADAEAAKAILDGASKSANDAANTIGNIGKNKSKVVNEKSYEYLTDAQLREKINRLSMEKSYGELTGDAKRVRSGADWTREILQTTGAVVGIAGTVAGIVLAINKIKLGSKDAGGAKT